MSENKQYDSSGHQAKPSDQIPVVNEYTHPAEPQSGTLYQKRQKIYARSITGYFQRIRAYTGWPLLLGFFLLPWFNWHGRQSVLFDLPARKFYILDMVFWPQDLVLLAWLLIIAAFALFFFTSLFGRIWCGYSCPQTVWTHIFMWLEEKAEGSRNQRIRLDQAETSAEKLLRKGIKHILWLGFAFLTGFTFVAYFTPVTDLLRDFFTGQAAGPAYIWIGIFTALTYINAGWMREQVCLYMCPYARFQSAMFDRDTLIVTYDAQRGEPRGSRRVHDGDKKPDDLGDCIDCQLCVQVCPTGIDIRNGLQYECINCALCVDACNSMMEKVGYAPNLICYSTENRIEGKETHLLRPRTIGYGLALVVMSSLFAGAIIKRETTDLNVLRERSELFQQKDDRIENVFTLKIGNHDNKNHTYVLSTDMENARIEGNTTLLVESGEELTQPLRVSISEDEWKGVNMDIHFRICPQDNPQHCIEHKSRFTGPMKHEHEQHEHEHE